MKPELQKLFEGVNGLSTDFLDKVSGLLESKVEAARLTAIQETEQAGNEERLRLVEAHQSEIAQLKESHVMEIATKVDSFLNAVVEEWANTNAPAIDAQIKREAAENLLTGLTGVLKEAGINFATDENGQIAALTRRLSEAEQRAAAAESENRQIKEAANATLRDSVISRICEGMVDTKKETVVNLLEAVQFTTESEFASRVHTFRNLVEGKSAKKEGDDDDFQDKVGGKDGDDDNKDNKGDKDKVDEGKKPKKEGDDDKDDDDEDEAGKELKESIRRQREAYRAKYGING
ncbi:putative prohead core protein [Dickeya phage phiDP23.1]|uniref:Scaffolding protein gp22 n=15 Tax=Aglimvirinae TaxID=2169530 RepID=I0J313_9CAUD|nr:putative scaffolding protein gp22 [Dickeya phage vB-DsoM-LIMEstone1]YP_009102944.1 putative prohead core protein [Dickeya phage RC-2014]AIM51302.1 putative prohead core protein [Dickeya phage phiD3]AIM51706.1 putative prohead core protein [Dickeya phage phiDP10.3]AIM51803.1 putative prohead core protein [Dickeya phage phiDP23.1]ASD51323.1 putative scaffolding protein [Dickeya phage JA15]ATW62141.1 putative scaffolding protein [Dickeya phage PP35]AYN55720.1 putative prohead core scaffold p